MEESLEQVKKHPASYLYVFVSNDFLNAIDPKHARIIRGKRANQQKLLAYTAENEYGSLDQYSRVVTDVRNAFKDIYGISPEQALYNLAIGKTVAGKNWNEGTYGVGATNTFSKQINGQAVTVDAKTGHILCGGTDVTDLDTIVYAEVGVGKNKKTVEYQLFSQTLDGCVFQSQYRLGSYYAKRYSDAEGKVYNASGKETGNTDSASIWGDINLDLSWFEKFINWILSLFGISPMPPLSNDESSSTISSANTAPNQKTDGFVSKAGTSETGVLLLCAAAAGYLLMGKKGKKYKANK